MSQHTSTAPQCDIRSATTRRLQAYADAEGLILHNKYDNASYRLTWDVLHQLEQDMLRGDRLTLLVKQVTT